MNYTNIDSNCVTVPYSGIGSLTVSPYSVGPIYSSQIRKVENGFIVISNGKEHVFNTIEGLLAFIKQTYKEGK